MTNIAGVDIASRMAPKLHPKTFWEVGKVSYVVCILVCSPPLLLVLLLGTQNGSPFSSEAGRA